MMRSRDADGVATVAAATAVVMVAGVKDSAAGGLLLVVGVFDIVDLADEAERKAASLLALVLRRIFRKESGRCMKAVVRASGSDMTRTSAGPSAKPRCLIPVNSTGSSKAH